jgi:1-acyl-sn-glycerol-3-phosphate acyltransferase
MGSMDVGKTLPQRRNPVGKALGRLILRGLGWRVEGQLPDLPKFVIIGAPHTSYWDGVIAFALVFALGIRVSVLVKNNLLRPPFGRIMTWLGALGIDRSAPKGYVTQLANEIRAREKLVLVIAPEGTRQKVRRWRSGFYHIARESGIPVVAAAAHFGSKTVTFSDPFWPTGDYETDVADIQEFISANGRGKKLDLV